jgi:hypothetical protein
MHGIGDASSILRKGKEKNKKIGDASGILDETRVQ